FTSFPRDEINGNDFWMFNPNLPPQPIAALQHSRVQVEVFDEEYAFNVSPYMPIVQVTREWTVDEWGKVLSMTIDGGGNGTIDEVVTIERDADGRPLSRTVEVAEPGPMDMWWSWRTHLPEETHW